MTKKLDLHRSLLTKDKRFLINYVHFDINKLISMVNFVETLDEHTRIEFRMDLLKDVNVIEENLPQK